MSNGVNRVILVGNLGADPELRRTGAGTPVLHFRLATNESYLDRDGVRREITNWHRAVMFGKRAEVVNKYFQKGTPIFLEGRLKFDQWQAQDGSKRSKLRVFVENFEFVGGGRQGGGQQGQGGGYGQQTQQPQAQQNAAPAGDFDSPPFDPTDDIPF